MNILKHTLAMSTCDKHITILVSEDTLEAFAIKKCIEDFTLKTLHIKTYRFSIRKSNIFHFLIYFLKFMAILPHLHFQLTTKQRKHFKIMLEAVRSISNDFLGDLFWWDTKTVSKGDILFVSLIRFLTL